MESVEYITPYNTYNNQDVIYMKGNLKMVLCKDMVDIFGREDNPMRESGTIEQLKEMEYFFILLEVDIKDN